jgi:hypothetical protein
VNGERSWTTVADIVATLERRWASGRYLKEYAAGKPWQPLRLSVKGPSATELLERLDAARSWMSKFERDSNTKGRPRFAVEYRTVQSRHVGENHVPQRVVVESFEQLCELLCTANVVRSFDDLLALTGAELPDLLDWVKKHPLETLDCAAIWPDLLATVVWMRANERTDLYLRHIDVAGVDTKFVENNQQLLTRLLIATFPEERWETLPGGVPFAARFGYLSPPSYTRLRFLDPGISWFPSALSEVAVRTSELAEMALPASRVFVVENEVTYLAFPTLRDSVAIFGAGFSLTNTLDLPWLVDKEVVYWGDIDTYGFEILDRLRSRLPCAASMMMDAETLLAHRSQWVVEPRPTNKELHRLTAEEGALYADLVEDRYGHHVRLEQERVRFGLVRQALKRFVDADPPSESRE